MSWSAYFDALSGDAPLHVEQAAIYVRSVSELVGLRQTDRIFDFGCGPGHVAALLAPRVAHVHVWDSSPGMRSMAAERTAHCANVRVCDLSEMPAGRKLGDSGFDLILVNSVLQYMSRDEVLRWLPIWRDMLAPGGRLVISDLIRGRHAGWSDLLDLVRLSAQVGFSPTAMSQAVGGFRRYRRTSRTSPLTRFDAGDLGRLAAEAGLQLMTLPANLTHFRKRWSAVLTAGARQHRD